ncbi:peptidase M23 [Bacterioplanes sanyensis]|uniref:peptidoglycan DD-metalloendopeptidase family protein n=1 Tax=Bacterioplanes sanyensis TaxID=1249553 RepID=UPI00167427C6|nr:M23 family metallopeptidase [Bacterioplanes sanyensis]GGY54289.1 peptidase M23 [Bacterioplanes sanyensis]
MAKDSRVKRSRIVWLGCLLCLVAAANAEIYRYQDENGRWVFSDKKPEKDQPVEAVEVNITKPAQHTPELYEKRQGQMRQLWLHNPYFAPVQAAVRSDMFERGHKVLMLEPNSHTLVGEIDKPLPAYELGYAIGSPKAKHSDVLYRIPLPEQQFFQVTQGFGGQFSHNHPSGYHAIDIAMPIGSYIHAARSGIVIWVKDDYHLGDAQQFFLDKANYVSVLHKDGTYAVYAHILQGSAMVKPGEQVKAGDALARSGTSGYSTGPHLHFVVRRNAGFRNLSVPYQFADEQGRAFVPTRGMKVSGSGRASKP